jgi:hypothetical protein
MSDLSRARCQNRPRCGSTVPFISISMLIERSMPYVHEASPFLRQVALLIMTGIHRLMVPLMQRIPVEISNALCWVQVELHPIILIFILYNFLNVLLFVVMDLLSRRRPLGLVRVRVRKCWLGSWVDLWCRRLGLEVRSVVHAFDRCCNVRGERRR